jgi:hypothetical protein
MVVYRPGKTSGELNLSAICEKMKGRVQAFEPVTQFFRTYGIEVVPQ